MPKRLTEKELKELKYVSMTDFSIKVKQYNDMNDKLRFATQYLLLHGTQQGEPDCSLAEATYIAQMSIVAASKVEKEKMGRNNEGFLSKNPQIVNPHVTNAKDDLAFELFLKDPKAYLKGYAEKKIDEIEDLETELPTDKAFKANCQSLINNELNSANFNSDVYNHFVNKNPVAIRLRTEMLLGGKDKLEELYNKTQPTWGAKLFRTTSQASKNLDTVYKAFNNPNHAMYGDKEALRKAANEYLEHKFPGWHAGDELPEEEASQLSGTSKARSDLSIALLKSIDAQEEFEDYHKNLVDETKKVQDIAFKDIDKKPVNQEPFHINLFDDLSKDEDMMANSFEENDISSDLLNDNEINID